MGHVTIPIPELRAWSTSVRRHTSSVVVALSSEVLFNFGRALLRAHASSAKQVTTVLESTPFAKKLHFLLRAPKSLAPLLRSGIGCCSAALQAQLLMLNFVAF
jgi:hypothetical protein